MQRSWIREAAVAIGRLILMNAILGIASAPAQDIELGKIQYQASCAACHGADAKGDGPLAKS
jgi:mono/diheme cytochrome c family protein